MCSAVHKTLQTSIQLAPRMLTVETFQQPLEKMLEKVLDKNFLSLSGSSLAMLCFSFCPVENCCHVRKGCNVDTERNQNFEVHNLLRRKFTDIICTRVYLHTHAYTYIYTRKS